MCKKIASIAFILLVFLSVALTEGQPSVGVKEGYWVEYSVKSTGVPPADQDLTWAKIEILDVEGEVFHANFTVKYVNGTVSSSVRTFNFTSGDVQAWIIIPSNLSPGKFFYDSSINSNVTIQGELQKTVAGATRTVTYTNSSATGIERNKQWDKATGYYIQSVDNLGTYTINAEATATNIWSPQILGLDQTVFYVLTGAIIVVVLIVILTTLLVQRKRPTNR